MKSRSALLRRRERLVKKLSSLSGLIRGSLIERHLRCGKAGCHCQRGKGHQAFYLTVTFRGGRTEQVTVPRAWVPTVRRWVSNYGRLWEILEEISAINRELLRRRWLEEEEERC